MGHPEEYTIIWSYPAVSPPSIQHRTCTFNRPTVLCRVGTSDFIISMCGIKFLKAYENLRPVDKKSSSKYWAVFCIFDLEFLITYMTCGLFSKAKSCLLPFLSFSYFAAIVAVENKATAAHYCTVECSNTRTRLCVGVFVFNLYWVEDTTTSTNNMTLLILSKTTIPS